ncbi:MAG TPA: DUF6376 family protein [Pseudoneobacillus sp.]|nr:DUF6376 family protein [Pseudoneobacillus sp.]
MKKLLIVMMGLLLMVLGGCSLLNNAKDTITYVNKATDYLGKATEFANDAPSLAQQAVNDPKAAKEFEAKLKDMKQEIQIFNNLQAPELAEDLHLQIVNQNTVFAQGIDLYLDNMVDGKLDPAILENTQIFQAIQEISSITDQIKKLGQ